MNILEKANLLVHGERSGDYGHPIEDFSRTAKIWSAILGIDVQPEQIPLCMIGVKLSRETNKHKLDNLIDIAGYAATLEMVEERGRDKLIYLASPYSSSDKTIKELRVEAVTRKTAELTAQGYFVFSPIVHSHSLTRYELPGNWEFWKRIDEFMISRCDEVWILQLEGWQESVGVSAEIEIAKKLKKKIRYISLDNS